jgi:hypothetical protein
MTPLLPPLSSPVFNHAYSIVHCGIKYDKLPGEWFGPGTAALVLRDISELLFRNYGGKVQAIVLPSNTVYISEIEEKMNPLATNSIGAAASSSESAADSEVGAAFFDPLLHRPPTLEPSLTLPWRSTLVITQPALY